MKLDTLEKLIDRKPDGKIRFKCEYAGDGYYHPVSKGEIRARLAMLPPDKLSRLHTVVLPKMTKKRRAAGLYGLAFSGAVYLYPVSIGMFGLPVIYDKLSVQDEIDFRRAGVYTYVNEHGHKSAIFTRAAMRDYYLDNILIHEIGHLNDNRKRASRKKREAFAQEFVNTYGYGMGR